MAGTARDRCPIWVNLILQGLILYSVITICLETMPELAPYKTFFWYSESIVTILFTLEYVIFWVLSDEKWKYPFRFYSVIDLISILPFYLSLGVDLRAMRALRFLRIFRILKLGRYSEAADTLSLAFRRCAPELSVTALMTVLVILGASMGLYYAENPEQPQAYTSIPACFWGTIVTLTTVGYGDVVPQTLVGRCLAMIVMLAGIALVAVPTGLLSSQLTEILRERRESQQERMKSLVHYRDD
ncbi:MAG: ion transporter [Gemmataceae bacterium]